MARIRTGTDKVLALGEKEIAVALDASLATDGIKTFYSNVKMRNPSRSYYVRYGSRLHSLKAIVAYTLRQQWPNLLARDFHAVDAARRLRHLGFDVVHNDEKTDSAREREWLSRLSRRGQAKFREKLIDLYGGCALCGCTTLPALEAAHVDPVKHQGKDDLNNGILLRADLHKLFDADLIAIHPETGKVHISSLIRSDYGKSLESAAFTIRKGGPQLGAFATRWKHHNKIGK